MALKPSRLVPKSASVWLAGLFLHAALILAVPADLAGQIEISGRVAEPRQVQEVALAAFESDRALASRFLGEVQVPPTIPQKVTRSGEFVLVAPSPGLWRVQARAQSGFAVELWLAPLVFPRELPPLDLPEPKRQKLVVTDAEGQGIPAARISAESWLPTDLWPWRPATRFLTTDERGEVELLYLPAETLVLNVLAAGFQPRRLKVKAEHLGAQARIRLERSPPLSLEVQANSMPVPGVLVSSREGVPFGFTDHLGKIRINTAPGTPLRFIAPGLERWEWLTPLKGESLTIELADGLATRGRVLGRKGDFSLPLSAMVFESDQPGNWVPSEPVEGTFEFPVFRGEPKTLTVWASGYAPAEEVQVPAGQEIRFTLEKADQSLAGRVVDDAGEPVADARIEVCTKLPRVCASLRSTAAGTFSLTGMGPKKVELAVLAAGFLPLKLQIARGPWPRPVEAQLDRGRGLQGSLAQWDGQWAAGATARLVSEVTGMHRVAVTDANGHFHIASLPGGAYDLTIEFVDHALHRQAVEVPVRGPTVDLGIIQLALGTVLKGQVRAPDGSAVADAPLWVWRDGWGSKRLGGLEFVPDRPPDATSSSDGSFELRHLQPAEVVDLEVRADDRPARVRTGIQVAENPFLELVVPAASKLSLAIRGGQGEPLAYAVVRLVEGGAAKTSFPVERIAHADEEGQITFENLEPGTIGVTVEAEGYKPHFEELKVEAEEHRRIKVTLGSGVRLAGRIVTADGAPVTEASVHCSWQTTRGELQLASGITDSKGTFDLSGLPFGKVILEVLADAQSPWREEIELLSESEFRDIRLPPVEVFDFRGRLVDQEGEPLVGLRVLLLEGRQRIGRVSRSLEGKSDEAGEFVVKDVPAGEYKVVVMETPGRVLHEVKVPLDRSTPSSDWVIPRP